MLEESIGEADAEAKRMFDDGHFADDTINKGITSIMLILDSLKRKIQKRKNEQGNGKIQSG